MQPDLIHALEEARAAEKAQALFYRGLAAAAEDRGDDALSERLNELHADEQHHVSRLTVRLMEMGVAPAELEASSGPAMLEGWEGAARLREEAEVTFYQALLARGQADDRTAALLGEILETERHHAEELGGKWTPA
jgi:rubrerythrin